jgi:hypothetical protein
MFSKIYIYFLRRKLKISFSKIVNSTIHYNDSIDKQFTQLNKVLMDAIETFKLISDNKNSSRDVKFYTYGFVKGGLKYCYEHIIESTEHWYEGADFHIHKKNIPIDILQFDPINQLKFVQITNLRKETIAIITKFRILIYEREERDWE